MVESSAELGGSLFWRTYIEEAADLIFTLDAAGKIAFVNRAVCEITGYAAGELLGKSPLEFIPSEMHELVETTLRNMLSGDNAHQVELEVLSRDGRHILLEVRGRALYDGGRIVGTVQIGRDIIERKRVEEKLRESEERFRGIAERSFDVVFTTDREGRITYVSPAVEKILGYKPEEVVGQPIQNYLLESEIPKAFQSLREALQGRVPEYLEFELRRKDGSPASTWISASSIVSRTER
jgi:PAS domain S-box-containing protein